MSPQRQPEVCPLDAALDRAIWQLTYQPGSTEELLTALDHSIAAARDSSVHPSPADLGRRLVRLNALLRNAAHFYDGWASLAGVSECDLSSPSFSFRG